MGNQRSISLLNSCKTIMDGESLMVQWVYKNHPSSILSLRAHLIFPMPTFRQIDKLFCAMQKKRGISISKSPRWFSFHSHVMRTSSLCFPITKIPHLHKSPSPVWKFHTRKGINRNAAHLLHDRTKDILKTILQGRRDSRPPTHCRSQQAQPLALVVRPQNSRTSTPSRGVS